MAKKWVYLSRNAKEAFAEVLGHEPALDEMKEVFGGKGGFDVHRFDTPLFSSCFFPAKMSKPRARTVHGSTAIALPGV